MVAKNLVPITTWVTPSEKTELKETKDRLHLSMSELTRRLVTNRRLPDSDRHKDVIALVKVNGDLARLGNLQRLALADEDFEPPAGTNLKAIFDDIRKTQTLLKKKIREL